MKSFKEFPFRALLVAGLTIAVGIAVSAGVSAQQVPATPAAPAAAPAPPPPPAAATTREYAEAG